MSQHRPQSDNMKALEQSLNDHMEICSLKRKAKRLKAKNARLTAEVEQLTQLRDTASWASERAVNRLQAEVVRLRKAGDAMVLKLPDMMACVVKAEEAIGLMNDWIAAKEGKPSC